MGEREAIVGPFTFDFSVPFTPGRVADMNQTVEAAGVAMRLQRVVVTPSETRAILCFEPPDGDPREWIPIITLDAANEQDLAGIAESLPTEKEGCYRCSFLASLQGQRGEWTLTVTELVGEDIGRLESYIASQADPTVVSLDAAEFQTRLAGPWVFRFRVP
jgi:hypothetical protein